MKKELRTTSRFIRSLTALFLATTMLFGSLNVFADDDITSDVLADDVTSDVSDVTPVQELGDNCALTIGESTLSNSNTFAATPCPGSIDIIIRFAYLNSDGTFSQTYNDDKITLKCTYAVSHTSGANHQTALKEFYPSKLPSDLQSYIKPGYEWKGFRKSDMSVISKSEAQNCNPTFYSFTSEKLDWAGLKNHYFFYVYEQTAPVEPEKPEPPTVNTLPKDIVKIDCVNKEINPEHSDALYDAINGTVTISEVYESTRSSEAITLEETTRASTEYLVDITFTDSTPYVDKYNQEISVGHSRIDDNDTRTVTLRYDDSRKTWVAVGNTPVVYQVICQTPDNKPEPPTITDLPKDIVKIDCVNKEINPEHSDALYDAIDGTVTIGEVYEATRSSDAVTLEETAKAAKEYLVDITFNNSKPYVDEYNKGQDVEHVRNDQNDTRKVTFKYDNTTSKWVPVDATPVVYEVICNYPDAPTPEEVKVILGEAVKLDCVNEQINPLHEDKTYQLKDNTFSVSSVFANDAPAILADGNNFAPFYVNVTINDPQPYIDEYSTQIGTKHVLNYNEMKTKTITLKYDDSQTPAKWVVNDNTMVPVTYQIICENPEKPTDPTNPTNPTNPTDPVRPIDPDRPSNPSGGDNDNNENNNDNHTVIIRETPTTTTIEDSDVPLTDLPEDTVTIDDEEVPLKDNPNTGDTIPVPAMVAAAISLGGIALLMKKHK